jgi:hypothetical protein
MITRLETLNSTSRAVAIDDVFPFVAVCAVWRRQPLAFDRHQTIEVHVSAAFNDDGSAAGCGNQINLAAPLVLVALFDPELKNILTVGMPGDTVEMGAKLRCQDGLRCLSSSIGAVSPTRQFVGYEVDQRMPKRRRLLDISVEGTNLTRIVRAVGGHS